MACRKGLHKTVWQLLHCRMMESVQMHAKGLGSGSGNFFQAMREWLRFAIGTEGQIACTH